MKSDSQKPFVAGISFKTAPVELREKLAVSPGKLRCTGCHLKVYGGLSEVVVLSTCNRIEIYGASDKTTNPAELFAILSKGAVNAREHTYVFHDQETARHLFSVAGGLDSMVLGETEIAGQVKHAYQIAQEIGLTGRTTNCLFQKALNTAKEIRSKTQVGRGATSVGSVAVHLAERIFGDRFHEKTVMIIGAGKMGEACLRHLAKKGVRSIIVSNRSVDRARELAGEFGGSAIRLEECVEAMRKADIVITSTGSPETILNRRDVEGAMRARNNRPLFLIDIAVPRNIDPAIQYLENVYLYNVDDLQELVRENVQVREREVSTCTELIAHRTAELFAKLGRSREAGFKIPERKEPNWNFGRLAPIPN